MSLAEIKLYLERARTTLQQSKDNLDWGYYDAEQFVERAAIYLQQNGYL